MDKPVQRVGPHLGVNGHFTVPEYPVVETGPGYRTATDLDLLAVRFPGTRRTIPGEDPDWA